MPCGAGKRRGVASPRSAGQGGFFGTESSQQAYRPRERYPYLQEAPFSIDGGVSVSIPLAIDGQIEALHVRGYIDRMDRVGDQIVLVDYKSGSTKIPVDDMREGRNFQMMVYLRAAEQLLAAQAPDARVAGACSGTFAIKGPAAIFVWPTMRVGRRWKLLKTISDVTSLPGAGAISPCNRASSTGGVVCIIASIPNCAAPPAPIGIRKTHEI